MLFTNLNSMRGFGVWGCSKVGLRNINLKNYLVNSIMEKMSRTNEILDILYSKSEREGDKLIKMLVNEFFEIGKKANKGIKKAMQKPNKEIELFLLQQIYFSDEFNHIKATLEWLIENVRDEGFCNRLMRLVEKKGSVINSTRLFQNIVDGSWVVELRDE